MKPILQQNKQNTPILERHLRMPRPLAGCSETLKRLIYVLSYEALQRFIKALSNLTRPYSSFLDQAPCKTTVV